MQSQVYASPSATQTPSFSHGKEQHGLTEKRKQSGDYISYSLLINAEPSRSRADLQDQVPRKHGPISIMTHTLKTRRADLWSMIIDEVCSNLVP